MVRDRPGYTAATAAAMRDAMRSADMDEYVAEPRLLTDLLDQSVVRNKFMVMLLGMFAVLALVLATIGLYAVMSHAVTQRTQEIGIRMALGANQANVLRMVLRQGMVLTVIGVSGGLVASLVLTTYLESLTSLLFGVKPRDPVTFVAIGGFLIVVALAACFIPARRATKIDPLVALRYE